MIRFDDNMEMIEETFVEPSVAPILFFYGFPIKCCRYIDETYRDGHYITPKENQCVVDDYYICKLPIG